MFSFTVTTSGSLFKYDKDELFSIETLKEKKNVTQFSQSLLQVTLQSFQRQILLLKIGLLLQQYCYSNCQKPRHIFINALLDIYCTLLHHSLKAALFVNGDNKQ